MIADSFIEELPDNPLLAIASVCDRFKEFNNQAVKDKTDLANYDSYVEFLALILAVSEAHHLKIQPPQLRPDRPINMQLIRKLFEGLDSQNKIEIDKERLQIAKAKFTTLLGKAFCYQFSEGDLKRIQDLINELREDITKSTLLQEDHRQRLLRRLEKLQSELHKNMSDLDRFWGLIGDAGIVLGKFGNDVKPIVDRIKELTWIVWLTQSRAEGLSSDSPMPLLKYDPSDPDAV